MPNSKNATKVEVPKIVTSVDAWMDQCSVPETTDTEELYDFLLGLNVVAKAFDRASGYVAWLRGKVFTQLKQFESYKTIEKNVGCSHTYRIICQRIAERYKTPEQIQGRGFSELRDEIDAEERAASGKPPKTPKKPDGEKDRSVKKVTVQTAKSEFTTIRTNLQALAKGVKLKQWTLHQLPEKTIPAIDDCVTEIAAITTALGKITDSLKKHRKRLEATTRKESQHA